VHRAYDQRAAAPINPGRDRRKQPDRSPLVLAGVTLHNFLVIGLMASVFIVLAKWASAKTGLAGPAKFFGAV
jgi:hypothetical protein